VLQNASRLLTLLMLGFAVMGFIQVPVFGKSGLNHVRDFLRSEPAQTAGTEIERSLSQMHLKLENELAQRSDGEPTSATDTAVSEAAQDDEPATLSRHARRSENRPRSRAR
jgi:hypothetical protein